ncbi:hypothetical protein EVG20_g11422 [Dentipellis fragilis]|uniref:GH18 domain-containing protein n=1 Tax=Dentipellis fragilis TaxID=205917 RepID=A0A4Y9XKU3_9AGAM|nr:hypothetical protein EVG20_g11422 [Dentipellis fragilis]
MNQNTQFTNLKQFNLNLKTFISVGGWSFNDPPTQHVFSNLASSDGNRKSFANSLVKFMLTYGFDGVDIDWEYPVACERDGSDADKSNMVIMFKTLRSVFDASGHKFGISFTAPSSFWYLQHFDLLGLLESADWVNLMSYDLHGVWDAKDAFVGNIVQAHTNLTEIEQSIQLFQQVGVPFDRITLGLGFYGRSFQLSKWSCTTPGCPFNGPAPGGPSRKFKTSLNRATKPVYDKDAQVNYLVYDKDKWISFDDFETFTAKVSWAKGAGLGGLMIWSANQDDFNSTALSAILGQDPTQDIPKARDINSKDGSACMRPGCGNLCPSGYIQMTDITDGKLAKCRKTVNGEVQLLSVTGSAKASNHDVYWSLYAKTHVYAAGEITLTTDSHGTGSKCSSGHKAFCCESGLTKNQIESVTDCKWTEVLNHAPLINLYSGTVAATTMSAPLKCSPRTTIISEILVSSMDVFPKRKVYAASRPVMQKLHLLSMW